MTSPTTPETRRRRGLLIGVGVAALALVVIIILALVLNRPTTDVPTSSPSPSASTTTSTPTPSPSAASPSSPADPTPSAPAPDVEPDPSNPAGQIVAPVDQPSTPSAGVTVALASIAAVQGSADEPGEVAGPAIKFVVSVTNQSADPLSLDRVVVNVDYGADSTPGGELNESGDVPLQGDLAPGADASGTYTFTVPEDQRGDVRISVFTGLERPTVVFSGVTPD